MKTLCSVTPLSGLLIALLLHLGLATPARATDPWVTVDSYLPDKATGVFGFLVAGPSNTVFAFCRVQSTTNYNLVRRSLDQGATWQTVSVSYDGPYEVLAAAITPQGALISAGITSDPSGDWIMVQLSNDGGVTWNTVDTFQALRSTVPKAAASDANGNIYILAASHDSSVGSQTSIRRSVDQGNTWDTIDTVVGDTTAGSLNITATGMQLTSSGMLISGISAYLDANGDPVWFGLLMQSTDQLASFNIVDSSFPGRLAGTAQDLNGNLVELGTGITNAASGLPWGWEIRRSTDGGSTWSITRQDRLYGYVMEVISDPVGGFFAAPATDILRSQDGGVTLTNSAEGLTGFVGGGDIVSGGLVSDGAGTIYLGLGGPQTWTVYKLALGPQNTTPVITTTSNGSKLSLSWPTNAVGFTLQSATTLSNAGDWQDMLATPTQINGQFVVTVSTTNAGGFFRLHK